jgi:hypothetical protein
VSYPKRYEHFYLSDMRIFGGERERENKEEHREYRIMRRFIRTNGLAGTFVTHEGNDESFHHFFRFIDLTVWLIPLQKIFRRIPWTSGR